MLVAPSRGFGKRQLHDQCDAAPIEPMRKLNLIPGERAPHPQRQRDGPAVAMRGSAGDASFVFDPPDQAGKAFGEQETGGLPSAEPFGDDGPHQLRQRQW